MPDTLILACAQHRLSFSLPKIMGIVNLNTQSFSQIGRKPDAKQAIAYAKQLIAEGADLIDLGAEPTNPYVTHSPGIEEEIRALVPVVQALAKETSVIISVDTSRAEVMQAVIDAGAHLINDVRALTLPGALDVVAKSQVGICLMHHLAVSKEVPLLPQIYHDLQMRLDVCIKAGIHASRICIDPGFGGGAPGVFYKTETQNRQLLQQLAILAVTPKRPLLVGLSRKGFIGRWMSPETPVSEYERLPGSLAAALWAVGQGANIIRTHDVNATMQALRVWAHIADE